MWFKKAAVGAQTVEDFGVAAGQLFRATGVKSILWEVGTVFRFPWESSPHVRLKRVGVPSDVKTIALETLRDQRFFQPEN